MRLTDPRVLTTLVLGMLFTGVFAFAVYTASLDDSVFQAPTIKADAFYVGGQTLAQYIAATAPGGGVGSNVTGASYTLVEVGGTYFAVNGTSGISDYSSAVFGTCLNQAIAGLAASGGGDIQLTKGTFNCAFAIEADDNVWVHGSGKGTIINAAANNISIFNIATSDSHFRLSDVALSTTYLTYTGVTAIVDDGIYTKLDRLWIDNVNTGIHVLQTANTSDRTYTDIYVLNFNNRGIWLEKTKDHFMSNINIGTQKPPVGGAAAVCFEFTEGGVGCHFNNFHIWADDVYTGVGVYEGAVFGTAAGVSEYDADCNNWEIENNGLNNGLVIQARGNHNLFNGITVKAMNNDYIQLKGSNNIIDGFYIRSTPVGGQGRYGIYCPYQVDNCLIANGRISNVGDDGIYLTSVSYNTATSSQISNVAISDITAGDYDINVYHVKGWYLSDISCNSASGAASIRIEDSQHTKVVGADLAYAMSVAGSTTGHELHMINNAGTWIP